MSPFLEVKDSRKFIFHSVGTWKEKNMKYITFRIIMSKRNLPWGTPWKIFHGELYL